MEKEQTKRCSICGQPMRKDDWGHNAQPINDGRCCNECNNLVIIRRVFDRQFPYVPIFGMGDEEE